MSLETSAVPERNQGAHSPTALSLRELHQALKTRGIEISYSALSEFVGTGDIAQQLHIEGGRNGRRIHPDVADILSEFLPRFRQAQGRLPQAPQMLRSFLVHGNSQASSAASGSEGLVPYVSETPKPPDPLALAAAQGRAQGLAEREEIYTAKQAAQFLCVSVRQLRRYVPASFRIGKSAVGDRWRRSDLVNL